MELSPQFLKHLPSETFDGLNDFTLNEEFDAIAASSDQQIDKNQSQTLDANATAVPIVVRIDKNQIKTAEDEIMHPDEVKVDIKMLQKLYKNSVETLEEAVLNNQMSKFKNHELEQSKTKLEQFHLFTKSMDLPMSSIEQVNMFETKLSDEHFREAVVNIIKREQSETFNIHDLPCASNKDIEDLKPCFRLTSPKIMYTKLKMKSKMPTGTRSS